MAKQRYHRRHQSYRLQHQKCHRHLRLRYRLELEGLLRS
ncbi:Uncharacterised protein [Vibrio cholerae]|nr:Uncharacterised protein [Vibrio cholerae]CSC03863.1 Uncharacterised protein [Vibrio cholerae]